MKLFLSQPHDVFQEIEAADLPPLTIITGRNGSGKSKLLQAISNGVVRIDGRQLNASKAPLKTWSNILPNLEKRGDFTEIRSQMKTFLQRQIRELQRPLLRPGSGISWQEVTLPQAEFVKLNPDLERVERITEMRMTFEQSVRQQLSMFEGDYGIGLEFNLAEPEALIAIENLHELVVGRNSIIEPGLIEHFCRFASLELQSGLEDLKRARRDKAFDAASAYLEFQNQHGLPPWDILNEMMADAGLDYEVTRPAAEGINEYVPRLINRSSRAEVARENLSTGEQVILALLLMTFQVEQNANTNRPDVLLLDEVDAPLHPTLARKYLDVIGRVLVKQLGMQVIAVTHSPSTIAMAPEEAIFELVATTDEPHRLVKRTKAQAINMLTDGVPTLAIDFSGNRQVFCESDTDAERYAALFTSTKTVLNSEKSLTFVGSGIKTPIGGKGSGKSIVSKIVGTLAKAENRSTFGLIDWDCVSATEPAGRVFFFSPGIRDGLENLIFDPLLLAGAVLFGGSEAEKAKIGFHKDMTVIGTTSWGKDQLQPIVDRIQEIVMDGTSEETIEISYYGGFSLAIRIDYLHKDDHELEELVGDRFAYPMKIAHGNNAGHKAGKLANYIVGKIVPELPHFVPTDLHDTFRAILDAEAS